MDDILQTYEWLQLRCGRFTSSEFWKLLVSGRRDMTPAELEEAKANKITRKTVDSMFGDTAMTYIYSKIAERLTLSVKQESNFVQTTFGKEMEWEAAHDFEEFTGKKGIYYGVSNPKFFPKDDNLGCSPDWISEDGKEGTDFKCPYDQGVHMKNLITLKSEEDLKRVHPEYYHQGQCTMWQLGLEQFHFYSFDKRYIEDKYKRKMLTIYPDIKWQEEAQIRVDEAEKIIKEILSQLN